MWGVAGKDIYADIYEMEDYVVPPATGLKQRPEVKPRRRRSGSKKTVAEATAMGRDSSRKREVLATKGLG